MRRCSVSCADAIASGPTNAASAVVVVEVVDEIENVLLALLGGGLAAVGREDGGCGGVFALALAVGVVGPLLSAEPSPALAGGTADDAEDEVKGAGRRRRD